MSNFLYLIRGGDEAFDKLSQEEKQAHEGMERMDGRPQGKGSALEKAIALTENVLVKKHLKKKLCQ